MQLRFILRLYPHFKRTFSAGSRRKSGDLSGMRSPDSPNCMQRAGEIFEGRELTCKTRSRNLVTLFFYQFRTRSSAAIVAVPTRPPDERDAFTPSESLTRSLFPRGRTTGVVPQYLRELGVGFSTIVPRGGERRGLYTI